MSQGRTIVGMTAAAAARRARRLLALAAMLAMPVACRDAASRATLEADRLRQRIESRAAADAAWKSAEPGLEAPLAQAREALRAGRLYLGLEALGEAEVSFGAVETSARAREPRWPGFEAAWRRSSVRLQRQAASARAARWERAPAAIRALSETAQAKTLTLLAASRSYAAVTGPAAGLYYLGEARGAADFASLCRRLDATRHGTAMPWRSVRPELVGLQERANAAFQPPRSIQLHGAFITLNATLKLAAELDAAGHYAGAAYQYLDAVEQLGMLDAAMAAPGPAAPRARQRHWQDRIAGLRSQLATSGRDGSLGELFLERAAAQLPPPGRGAADDLPDAARQARLGAILDRVMPAYAALVAAAPRPASPAAAAAVTVTLVRWPYT